MASKVFFLLFICLFSSSLAGTVQWTGAAGNSLWSFANNWLGNAVPTNNDDVVINALGGASVSVSQPAVARSITIQGSSYAQSLTLLSSLTVGAGGITVQQGGTLQVSSNNNLPLASAGAVTFASGSNFVFQSGAITGPGEYVVNAGAVLTFSQSALKLITAATVNVTGTINIQGSTIQLDSNGVFINNGNATAIGAVTFLSTDASANLFESNGGFVYQGQMTTSLTFQTPTFFSAPLIISSGDVAINSNFTSKSTVEIPTGSTLKVGAGTGAKNFNSLKGTGILSVAGNAIINSPVSLSVFEITDSGSLTFNAAASFASAEVGGVLNAMAVVSVTNLTLAGGTITGTGSTAVTGTLLIQSSDTGNTNNFISSILTLYGTGTASTAVYLLLGQGGQFHIAAGATFNILNTFTFGIQSGKPLVIVDGTVSVTQTAGQTFTSNVDFTSSGAGSLKVNAGTLTFNGDIVTLGTLFLAQPAAAVLNTVVATIGAVTGAGSLNLTAAPSPVSSLTTVAVSNLNVLNGNVNIGSLAVNNWGFWSGTVTLASGSTNSASNFNLYGGSLIGAAKLSLSAFNIILNFPVTLNGVAIKTGSYSLQAPAGTGSLQISNGATIIAVAMSETVSRGNVNIN